LREQPFASQLLEGVGSRLLREARLSRHGFDIERLRQPVQAVKHGLIVCAWGAAFAPAAFTTVKSACPFATTTAMPSIGSRSAVHRHLLQGDQSDLQFLRFRDRTGENGKTVFDFGADTLKHVSGHGSSHGY
jgi:hypothetical protein